MAAVARHSCGSIGLRPTRSRVVAVLAVAVVVGWIALPSAAPAADVDLTPSVLKDRAAVGLPAVLGPTERYGVVLPKGSKLRPLVSKAVLALQRDGTIRKAAAASFRPTLGSIPVIR